MRTHRLEAACLEPYAYYRIITQFTSITLFIWKNDRLGKSGYPGISQYKFSKMGYPRITWDKFDGNV